MTRLRLLSLLLITGLLLPLLGPVGPSASAQAAIAVSASATTLLVYDQSAHGL
ncbi:MAG: hypothetical protein IT340_21040 [Chloroflexi bacterium]|nr:hypothetical protein [Chloroflexota bacterium]